MNGITSPLPQKWLQIDPGLELQTHVSQPSAFSRADTSNINRNLAKRISNLTFEFYLGRQKFWIITLTLHCQFDKIQQDI